MIRYFKAKRIPLIPSSWVNSVTAWCLGVFSPKGTISIKNTATPKEGGGSLQLDVNIEKVASLVQKMMDASRELTERERQLVKAVLTASVDQKYITCKHGTIGLDVERLKKVLYDPDQFTNLRFRPVQQPPEHEGEEPPPVNNTSRMHDESDDDTGDLIEDEWVAGGTDGFRMLVVSREEVDDKDDPSEHYLYFREATFGANGTALSVGKELGCVKILA